MSFDLISWLITLVWVGWMILIVVLSGLEARESCGDSHQNHDDCGKIGVRIGLESVATVMLCVNGYAASHSAFINHTRDTNRSFTV